MRPTPKPIRLRPVVRDALLVALLYSIFLLPFAFASQSCGGAHSGGGVLAEVHARAALDMTREFVDPAYELAVRACKDQQTAVYLVALDGGDMATARSKLASIQARCQKATDAFDAIREWHDQASALVENGRIADAENVIGQIKEALRTILERTNTP
jgi:hypothetical protein